MTVRVWVSTWVTLPGCVDFSPSGEIPPPVHRPPPWPPPLPILRRLHRLYLLDHLAVYPVAVKANWRPKWVSLHRLKWSIRVVHRFRRKWTAVTAKATNCYWVVRSFVTNWVENPNGVLAFLGVPARSYKSPSNNTLRPLYYIDPLAPMVSAYSNSRQVNRTGGMASVPTRNSHPFWNVATKELSTTATTFTVKIIKTGSVSLLCNRHLILLRNKIVNDCVDIVFKITKIKIT